MCDTGRPRPSYQQWTVWGYKRPETYWTSDGERVATGGTETVVVVFDPRGWRWEVTADATGLTEVTVAPTAGQRVDQAAMRLPPLGYLHDAARTYLQSVTQDREAGHSLHSALEDVDTGPARRVAPPSPETFAAAWRETTAVLREGKRVPRRQVLATRFGVSVYAVDKWTRAARDAGLLPEVKTGRTRGTADSAAASGEPEQETKK